MPKRPKRDDILVVEQPFETTMVLYWRDPRIEERPVTLPAGLEMKVIIDPTMMAKEAKLQPTDINGWEPTFFSAEELKLPMYGGYAFSVPFSDLANKCQSMNG